MKLGIFDGKDFNLTDANMLCSICFSKDFLFSSLTWVIFSGTTYKQTWVGNQFYFATWTWDMH